MRFIWKSILISVFTCWADEQPKSNSDASNSDDQEDASRNQQSSSLEDDELYIKVERGGRGITSWNTLTLPLSAIWFYGRMIRIIDLKSGKNRNIKSTVLYLKSLVSTVVYRFSPVMTLHKQPSPVWQGFCQKQSNTGHRQAMPSLISVWGARYTTFVLSKYKTLSPNMEV